MKYHSIRSVILWTLALGGCSTDARLYPANNFANDQGTLSASFDSYGTGNGEIEVRASQEEIFRGKYILLPGDAEGFGGVYDLVYGPGASALKRASILSRTLPREYPGTASLFSTKGRAMQCEFYNDNLGGQGIGACKRSDGALYRLQY